MKVNCDGAYKAEDNVAGTAALIRNHEGSGVGGVSKKINAYSSLIAEAFAFQEGMKLALALQHRKVIVESDSECSISFINSIRCQCRWEIRPFIEEIKRLKL